MGYYTTDDDRHSSGNNPSSDGFVYPDRGMKAVCAPELPSSTYVMEPTNTFLNSFGPANYRFDEREQDMEWAKCMSQHANSNLSISFLSLLIVVTVVVSACAVVYPSDKKGTLLMVLIGVTFNLTIVLIGHDNTAFRKAFADTRNCIGMNESAYYSKIRPDNCAISRGQADCVEPYTANAAGTECTMNIFVPGSSQSQVDAQGRACADLTKYCTDAKQMSMALPASGDSNNPNNAAYVQCLACTIQPNFCAAGDVACSSRRATGNTGCSWSGQTATQVTPFGTSLQETIPAKTCYYAGAGSSYTYEDCPSNAITNYLLEYGGASTCYNPRFTSGNANIGGGNSFIGTDPATKYPECSEQNFEKCWEQVRQDSETQAACTWDPLEVKTCACTSNSASSGNYELCRGKSTCAATDSVALCTESRLHGVSSTNQWKM